MEKQLAVLLSSALLVSSLTSCSGEQSSGQNSGTNDRSNQTQGEMQGTELNVGTETGDRSQHSGDSNQTQGEKGQPTQTDGETSDRTQNEGEMGERTEGEMTERTEGELTEATQGEKGERTEGEMTEGTQGEKGERTEGESSDRTQQSGDSSDRTQNSGDSSGERTQNTSNTSGSGEKGDNGGTKEEPTNLNNESSPQEGQTQVLVNQGDAETKGDSGDRTQGETAQSENRQSNDRTQGETQIENGQSQEREPVKEQVFLYNDVAEDHWATKSIVEVVDAGVFSLTEEGSFVPDATLSGEEFAQMLYTFLGNLQETGMTTIASHSNTMVLSPATNWTGDDVLLALEALTRGQAAEIMGDFLLSLNLEMDAPTEEELNALAMGYVDGAELSEQVLLCAFYGIMVGTGRDTFGGESLFNRAQAATVISRLMNGQITLATTQVEEIPQPQEREEVSESTQTKEEQTNSREESAQTEGESTNTKDDLSNTKDEPTNTKDDSSKEDNSVEKGSRS